jgi:hypothetical protein
MISTNFKIHMISINYKMKCYFILYTFGVLTSKMNCYLQRVRYIEHDYMNLFKN